MSQGLTEGYVLRLKLLFEVNGSNRDGLKSAARRPGNTPTSGGVNERRLLDSERCLAGNAESDEARLDIQQDIAGRRGFICKRCMRSHGH